MLKAIADLVERISPDRLLFVMVGGYIATVIAAFGCLVAVFR